MRLDNLTTNDILKLPFSPVSQRWNLPCIPAIYFVIKAPDLFLYIGQTKNLYNRFQSHQHSKDFEKHYDYFDDVHNHPKIFYLDCSGLSEEERIFNEYQYIGKLNPIYNIAGTFGYSVKNYTIDLFKILLNLNHIFLKQEVVDYINLYSYGIATKFNPIPCLNLLNKIQLLDYFITRKDNQIIYQFYFKISESINQKKFHDFFVDTIIQYQLLPKNLCDNENISLAIELFFSCESNMSI